MRTPLIERLPPNAPELDRFDASVDTVDHRRASSRFYSANTIKAHKRRYARYVEWCAEVGEQSDPAWITTEKISAHVAYLASTKRMSLETIRQAIRALELYARRAGVEVSTEPAYGVMYSWWRVLAELGLAKPPKRLRAPRRRS